MTTRSAEAETSASPRYFKVAEVAAYLNLGKRTVYELIAAGTLTAVPMGSGRGTLRVPADALYEYEARLRAAVST